MKFQPERAEGVNVINRHDGQRVWINGIEKSGSVLVPWKGDVLAWNVTSIAELTPAHFEQVLQLRPELVIFGSGARLRFVSPAVLRALIDARIGVETMDTAAACRTYNVLVSEGRIVAAALIIEGPKERC